MGIRFTFLALVFSAFCGSSTAQNLVLDPTQIATPTQVIPNNPLGTCAATCVPLNIPNPTLTSNPKGGGNNQTMNGNGTNATIYTASACGLNYVLGEVKTGKRYFPAAANQPVAISITGIPVCRTILRAYLYVGGSGNGIAFSTTMVNPAASASVFPMTAIGNHSDKCWGYTGTYNYRADVTALITGNGNYMVSGIPTSITTPGNDMDGASLVIVYTDPTQNYTGNIVIGDGCQVGLGGTQTNNLTGWNACGASTFANAFMIVSDLQNVGQADCQMNSAAVNVVYPGASQDWWDNIPSGAIPAVFAGQNSVTFGCTSNFGDCYNIVCEGLYFRNNCLTCNVVPLAVTTATTSSCTVGSATAFATGGQGPYSYTWTPSAATTSFINSVAPGTYTIKVADATGCNTTQAVVVIPPGSATITATSATVCPGVPATLNASGALTYTWNPGNIVGSSATFTPPATQVYTVIGSAAGGCTAQATGTITVNPVPVPIPNSNSPVCAGGNINLSVNAFTSYTWTGPNTFNSNVQNPTITNASTLNAGSYTVKVTSALGCTAQAVVNVIVNPTPTITVSNTGPYCAGSAIQLNVTAANTYTWTGPLAYNSNAQNPTIANSTTNMAGPYVVTVTAVGGCISTGTTTVVVNALPSPTATSNAPVCLNQTINLNALGGNTYTWTGPNSFTTSTQNPTIPNAALVNAGPYILWTTNGNGCTNSVQIVVNVNPLPVVVANNPITCVGSAFNLTAGTGTSYAWTGPNAYSSALQNPPFASAQTSLNGNYTVVVTSAQGCTNSAVATISIITNPTVTVAGTNTFCSQNFNGSPATTNLTASGASTYQWTLPPGFSATPNLNSNPITLTPPVTSTSVVATMTVLGTAGSCTHQAVYQVTVYPNPTIAVTSASMCAGTQVTLTASNASTYTWSPATALNTTSGPVVIANPAITTVYSVIGSSVGCNSQTQNSTASVVPNPTVILNPNPAVICLGNSINLTAVGATNYSWSPNTALTSTNTANTTANPTVTTVYQVIGSQNTCTHVTTMTVQVLPLPTVNIVPSSPTLCMNNFNGSPNTITLTANGAASYTWGPIIGLTTNTLNGSTVIGASNGNPNPSGSVIGANGTCTSSATFTLNAIPNPVIATTSGSMCAGTSVSLTAANAQTYTWSPSATLNTANGPIVIASPTVTTVYSVIGSSAGCQGQTQNAIATVVNNPTVSIAPLTPTICFGTSINLNAAGANNYTWSPNTAISSTVGANVTVSPTVTTTYQIIGEAATCTNTAQLTVTVVPLPIINIALSSPTMCMNNFNGSVNQITVTAIGATSYNWTGFTNITSNTSSGPNIIVTSIPGQPMGTGTVIGSAQTCTNSATFTVLAAPNPIIAVPSVSVCQFKSVDVVASGATTYTWSPATTLNSATGATVSASPALTTVYSVIGSSMNCNSPTQQTTVDVVPNPVLNIAPLNPTICAGSAIALNASGANNYTWTPNTAISSTVGASVMVNPTVTTVYQVMGEAATCTSVAIRQVSVIPLPDLQATVSPSVICVGDKANINANGATSYTWTPPVGLSNAYSSFVVANPTVSMVYGLIGTNGICTTSINVTLSVTPRPLLLLSTDNPRICKGASASIFASGAMSYSWTPAVNGNVTNTTMATVSPSISTRYTVTGYNAGCPFTKEIEIEVIQTITATVSNSIAICQGESIRLTAGGSNTYLWVPNAGLSNTRVAMPYADPKETTEYTVFVSDGGNCPVPATVLVKVNPLPVVNAGPDVIFNADEPMYLNAVGTGTLTWTFGEGIYCHDCPNSQVMTKNSGNYKIQAVNEFGCKAIDDVNIEVTNDYSIYIPNVFTPNFDGNNETFLVYGVGISDIAVTIFDRWGEQIYHDDNQTKGWDGTYKDDICKNDVYVYLVKFTSLDGKRHTKTGHVTLMK